MSRPMYVRHLTKSEQAELSRLICSNRDVRILRRAQMVRLSVRGKKTYRDSRNLGCYRGNRLANHPEFQLRWTQVAGRQAPQRSTTKNNQSLCTFIKRGGAEITPRLWLSIQFLDTEAIARTSWTQDRHSAESVLSFWAYGSGGHSLSPPKAHNGTFAKSQGLQRKEGYLGVVKKGAVKRQARFELLLL